MVPQGEQLAWRVKRRGWLALHQNGDRATAAAIEEGYPIGAVAFSAGMQTLPTPGPAGRGLEQ